MNCTVGRTVVLTGGRTNEAEHRVACQVYLKSLPLLLSHVCLCLGENHASVKEATGVKGAVCVLLVAALSIV